MNLFIENASILDGTGKDFFKANIGIKDNKIVYIGKEKFTAERIINANGLILTPGFIDTHSHSEFTILAAPEAEGKITQGITTEINGNCGVSCSPMIGEVIERKLPELTSLELTTWNTIQEYISQLERVRPAINFATLCGHGNIRGSIIGYKNIKVRKKDIKKMKELLYKELLSGVKGLSTGLIYPPGMFADSEEIIELARTLKKFKGIYATHMRSEGDKLFGALEETILIGRMADISVHISHLKTSGKGNWWKIDSVLKMIEDVKKEGLKISADRYPYIASATDLDAMLPSWIVEGTRDDIIKRLRSDTVRKKIKEYLKQRGMDFLNSLLISDVAYEKDKKIEGKRLGELTDLESASQFICDILIRSNLYVGVIYFGMKEENLEKILSQPYVMIGTDSSARCSSGITAKGKPHPRGFGSFPRFIKKYVLDRGLLSLQDSIRKITYLPAKTFRIEKRGLIKEGYFSDIVIFDPAEIEDRATFTEPFNVSKGIKYVIVNGEIAVEDGTLTGKRNGKVLL